MLRKLSILAATAGLMAVPLSIGSPAHAAEGCGAVFSAGATGVGRCTYVASANGAIIASSTNWKVTITRGGSSSSVGGTAPEYRPSSEGRIRAGDVVTAEVFGPGSVIVGTATEGNNIVPPQP